MTYSGGSPVQIGSGKFAEGPPLGRAGRADSLGWYLLQDFQRMKHFLLGYDFLEIHEQGCP